MNSNPRAFKMPFSDVYPLYIKKAERKGRTKDEVDQIIFWLTGYDAAGLQQQLNNVASFDAFFDCAPNMNPKRADHGADLRLSRGGDSRPADETDSLSG